MTATLAAASDISTSAAIMLVVAQSDADRLTGPEVDPPEWPGFHCTLGYIADITDVDDQTKAALVDQLRGITSGAVAAKAFASAHFNLDDADRDPCAVLLVQSDDLANLHDAVTKAIEPLVDPDAAFPIWIPHVTVQYNADPDIIPDGVLGDDLSFDRLVIGWGDEQINLGGNTITAATEAAMTAPTINDTAQVADDAPEVAPANQYPDGTQWAGPLVQLDKAVPASTGWRMLPTEGFDMAARPFPLPLSYQAESSHGGQEPGTTVVVGRIVGAEVQAGMIVGWGDWLDPGADPQAQAALHAAQERLASGLGMVSIDSAPTVMEYGARDGDGNVTPIDPMAFDGDPNDVVAVFAQWELMGATMVADPAFGTARIAPVEGALSVQPEAMVASVLAFPGLAEEHVYPAEWFEPVALDGPTHLTITEEGRVFGHLAEGGTCHLSFGECVNPPLSPSAYAYFHVNPVKTTAGLLAVGKLTVGGGHADINDDWIAATEHYDNAGAAVAVVRAYEDDRGNIMVVGALLPNATGDQIAALRRNDLSGDWRPIGGERELVGALSVNTAGFQLTPRAALAADGRPLALVAAGIVHAPPADQVPDTTGAITLPSGAKLSAVDLAVVASAFDHAATSRAERLEAGRALRSQIRRDRRAALLASQ